MRGTLLYEIEGIKFRVRFLIEMLEHKKNSKSNFQIQNLLLLIKKTTEKILNKRRRKKSHLKALKK